MGRILIDGVDVKKEYILFPYERIEREANVILYGAGDIGLILCEQINKNKYCNIIAFADMLAREKRFGDGMPKCILPEEILEEDYDYIVMAKTKGANIIIKDLVSLGIDENKIVVLRDENIVQMSMSRFIGENEKEEENFIRDYEKDLSEDDIYTNNVNYIKKNNICSDRKNIIDWYEFEKNENMLQMGSDFGVLSRRLCEELSDVTIIEFDEDKRKITSVRCKKCKNMNIVSDKNEIENKRFKYVLIYGIYAEKEEYWNYALSVLKDDGVLILTGENKYSFEHWATIAEGMTKYRVFKGIDIKGFEEWKEKYMKNYQMKTFFPVPSYQYPERVYSKEYQPEFSSIRGARGTHMNSNLVYDALEYVASYDKLPNSYLIILENKQKNYPVYLNYKRKRKKDFRIETRIIRNDKRYVVQKRALCEEAKEHIQRLIINQQELEERYVSFEIIPATRIDKQIVEFPYYKGESLDSYLWKNYEDQNICKEIIKRYCDKVRNIPSEYIEIFKIDDEFENVFGKISYEGPAMKYSNVDAIFDNILIQDEKWFLFDYEWVFPFLVPINFVIYRAIEVFFRKYASYIDNKFIEEIWQISGLTSEECEMFQSMNLHLWKYFTENNEARAAFEK